MIARKNGGKRTFASEVTRAASCILAVDIVIVFQLSYKCVIHIYIIQWCSLFEFPVASLRHIQRDLTWTVYPLEVILEDIYPNYELTGLTRYTASREKHKYELTYGTYLWRMGSYCGGISKFIEIYVCRQRYCTYCGN